MLPFLPVNRSERSNVSPSSLSRTHFIRKNPPVQLPTIVRYLQIISDYSTASNNTCKLDWSSCSLAAKRVIIILLQSNSGKVALIPMHQPNL